jgi:hypothetical protein
MRAADAARAQLMGGRPYSNHGGKNHRSSRFYILVVTHCRGYGDEPN